MSSLDEDRWDDSPQVAPEQVSACYIWGMDLKERVLEAMTKGKKRVERERELGREFTEGWKTKVREILEEMKEAGEAVGQSGGLGSFHTEHHDDCAILSVGIGTVRPIGEVYRLRFCPKAKERRIACHAKPDGLLKEQTYSLEGLSVEVVHDKLLEFVDSIFDAQVEAVRGK